MDKNKAKSKLDVGTSQLRAGRPGNCVSEPKFIKANLPKDTEVSDRPTLKRNLCEFGVYMDIFEFMPVQEKLTGSPQFLRMTVQEKLYEHLQQRDMLSIKNAFDEMGVFKGCVLEMFRPGIILVVGVNSTTALDDLVKLYFDNTLTSYVQRALITEDVLALTTTSHIHVTARLWEDEFRSCREEIQQLEKRPAFEITSLQNKPSCIKTLSAVRKYLKVLCSDVIKLRDMDSDIETICSELIFAVKSQIPIAQNKIQNMEEFLELANRAVTANDMEHAAHVKPYLDFLNEGKRVFATIKSNIVVAMDMVYTQCEKPRQKETRNKILQLYKDTNRLLNDSKYNMSSVKNDDWFERIPQSVHGLFLAPFSIVTIVVDAASEIDSLTDEYISEFPDAIPV